MNIPANPEAAAQRVLTGTLSEAEAIAYILDRLDDMFEAINGVRPARLDDPLHTLIARIPTLTDYGEFVRQSHEASRKADQFKQKFEEDRRELIQQQHAAVTAAGTLVRARHALREALRLLDSEPTDLFEELVQDLATTWDYTTEEVADIREKMAAAYALGVSAKSSSFA